MCLSVHRYVGEIIRFCVPVDLAMEESVVRVIEATIASLEERVRVLADASISHSTTHESHSSVVV